jgi:hypothetical protein
MAAFRAMRGLGDDIRGTRARMRTAVASHLRQAGQVRGRLP